MPLLIWILCGLAAILCLLLLTPIRILATVRDRQAAVTARVGLITVFRYPRPPAAKRREKKRKKPPRKKEEPQEKAPAFGVPPVQAVREALRRLPGPLRRTVVRLFRSIHVKPLRVALIFGGMDSPDSAAQSYGYANAAIWKGMPLLERVLDIPSPELYTAVDFTAEETELEADCGVSVRVGALLLCGLMIGIPALGFLFWMVRTAQSRETPKDKKRRAKGGERQAKGKSISAENDADIGQTRDPETMENAEDRSDPDTRSSEDSWSDPDTRSSEDSRSDPDNPERADAPPEGKDERH